MQDDAAQMLDEWKRELERGWREIPKPFRNEYSVKRTLQCQLYRHLLQTGHRIVADFLPPRIQDRPVDLIAVTNTHEIVFAVCIDSLVTLAAVKSLSSFEAAHKVILTTGLLLKKVQESRFFLKPEIQHVHLQPFEQPF
jgi:hypothetical protein